MVAINTNTTLATLSDDQLHRSAPSIFASTPWHRMSDRYRFVPTIEVVDMLRDRGFLPVRAQQSRSRIEGKGAFTKHLVRFRHDSLIDTQGDEIPELVLVNSHDGTSSYQLMAGIFRLVCSNGLVVQSADFGSIRVHHSGGQDFQQRVIDATYQIVEEAPRTMAAIEEWKAIELSRPQQLALAEAAMEIRPNESIRPAHLLTARREADYTDSEGRRDLWRTANVLQENLLQGGVQGRNATGRKVRTRPIKSVGEDVRVNRALWTLTAKMAELV